MKTERKKIRYSDHTCHRCSLYHRGGYSDDVCQVVSDGSEVLFQDGDRSGELVFALRAAGLVFLQLIEVDKQESLELDQEHQIGAYPSGLLAPTNPDIS